MKLADIEGIGDVYASRLKSKGISSTQSLLEKGATPKGRKQIAQETGISERMILDWVNMADMLRIRGIGGEYSDLLNAAGVDTVGELAHRKPENLYDKFIEVNSEKRLVRKLPAKKQVADWVIQAKKLPKAVSHSGPIGDGEGRP